MTASDWSSQLVAAIEHELGARGWTPQVRSIKATSSEEVEIIYSDGADQQLRGIRVHSDLISAAPERIRVSSIEELAFDIVVMGICEPRSPEEFLPPDANGVRWLFLPEWLAEIS